MKKKVIATVLTLVMTISLAACGSKTNDPSTTNTPAPTSSAGNTSNNKENNGSTETNGEKVTITYAHWNLGTEEENNIQRRMITAFNEMQDSIEVVIADNMDYSKYAESLTTLAAAGDLPDIMGLSNIYDPYMNKWIADITDIVEADEEWEHIIPVLKDSSYINGRAMVVPFAIHFWGILTNEDAFDKANVPSMPYNPTLQEFDEAVAAVTKLEEGIVAIRNEVDLINILPAVMNSDLGFFTFNGERFALDSSEFLSSIRKISDYRLDGYAWSGLTESQQTNFVGTNAGEAWGNGEVGIAFDGSYALGGLGKSIHFNITYKGMLEGRTVIIPDFFGVAATSEHPKEAFEFMKWMSYGSEGFSKRIDIAKEIDVVYFGMPMTTEQALLNKFFDFLPVEGLNYAYDDLDNAILEPVKTLPGYNLSRWNGLTGIKIGDIENANINQVIEKSILEGLNYADYAKTVNDVANESYQQAMEAMNK